MKNREQDSASILGSSPVTLGVENLHAHPYSPAPASSHSPFGLGSTSFLPLASARLGGLQRKISSSQRLCDATFQVPITFMPHDKPPHGDDHYSFLTDKRKAGWLQAELGPKAISIALVSWLRK